MGSKVSIETRLERAAKTKQLAYSGLSIQEIPSKIFAMGTKLKTLDLSSNKISLLPAQIGQLSELRILKLFSNQINVLPLEILSCSLLETLDVSNNKLCNITFNLADLKHLKILDLSKNSLDTIINLPYAVEKVNLSHNKLSSLPLSITQLEHLKDLDISHNIISSLPSDWTTCISLQIFRFEKNQIEKIPKSLFTNPSVFRIDMIDNPCSSNADYQDGFSEYEKRRKQNIDKTL